MVAQGCPIEPARANPIQVVAGLVPANGACRHVPRAEHASLRCRSRAMNGQGCGVALLDISALNLASTRPATSK